MVQEGMLEKLASILNIVVNDNNHASWLRLLCFSSSCLHIPQKQKCGKQPSLISLVNKQLSEEIDPPVNHQRWTKSAGKRNNKDPLTQLVKRVSVKLEEGDFKGVVHLACSSSTIADRNDATLDALKKKHPPPHQDTFFPPLSEEPSSISASEEEIIGAIRSFPNGSAGIPYGLSPQHLKDMIRPTTIDGGAALASALARFVSLVLEGRHHSPFVISFSVQA